MILQFVGESCGKLSSFLSAQGDLLVSLIPVTVQSTVSCRSRCCSVY